MGRFVCFVFFFKQKTAYEMRISDWSLDVCSSDLFGAQQLRPHVQTLSHLADTLIMVYPNAGLPNELGQYDEMPEQTAALVREWAEQGQVNILGGCCGSTPGHIAAMRKAVEGLPPRAIPHPPVMTRLAGLEPMNIAA